MITRPLDLASRLRPPPRSMDAVFYANVVLLGLFFAFFGSRFVLSPGVALLQTDFAMPASMDATVAAVSTTAVISVLGPDMVFTDAGRMTYAELALWLPGQVARGGEAESRLLVRADARVSARDLMRLSDLARGAGFSGVQLALESKPANAFGPNP
ncbi:ExbD/TolR family protein [Synoicihabitans lomoniglobus]|uniref:Biopolymer transport protein ExbD/TolR n=1 Tax=Synoicihabitans lomoniglobus TaxID=2909285 RepID=A0AAF0A214_9BACT|nr:biopolymer transporter ExbD [Opitutaceae bacterium LMO-M01]WED65602.1 hypothetical protein PXH66_01895 [Opitutaceae bacterium LMO-M01]